MPKKLIIAGAIILALGILVLPRTGSSSLILIIPGALIVGIPLLINYLRKRDAERAALDANQTYTPQRSQNYVFPPVQTSSLPKRTFSSASKPYQNRLRRHFIAIDFETSGLSPTQDRIIEIGAVRFENGNEIDSFSCLVQSVSHVPASATSVNHITDAMLLHEGLSEAQAFHDFVDYLGEDVFTGHIPLISHNANFDMRFFQNTLDRLCVGLSGDIRYFDTLSLSRKHLSLSNYKQETVAQSFGLTNPQAHRAVEDARICGQIMLRLFEPMGIELYTSRIPRSYNLTDQEKQVCVAVRQTMDRANLDTRYLRFNKHASGTIWIKSPRGFAGFHIKQGNIFFLFDARDFIPCALSAQPIEYNMSGFDLVEVYTPNLNSIAMLTASFSAGYRRVYPELEEYYSYSRWVQHDSESTFTV